MTPSYHGLYITTRSLVRTRLFDLPYDVDVRCNRSAGWTAWRGSTLLGGEYEGPQRWLRLDVNGVVIVDSSERSQFDKPKDDLAATLAAVDAETYQGALPWRVGRSWGRTIVDAHEQLIGMMDSRWYAQLATESVNLVQALREKVDGGGEWAALRAYFVEVVGGMPKPSSR